MNFGHQATASCAPLMHGCLISSAARADMQKYKNSSTQLPSMTPHRTLNAALLLQKPTSKPLWPQTNTFTTAMLQMSLQKSLQKSLNLTSKR
jgi:hypothetical protein